MHNENRPRALEEEGPELTTAVGPVELENPDFVTILRLVFESVKPFVKERAGQIIGSGFLLLMLWGTHGKLELLGFLWPAWGEATPGSDPTTRPDLIPGVPWDYELVSFWGGALIIVLIPVLLIKLAYKEKLSDYGLGWPTRGRLKVAFWGFATLTLVSLPAFWLGASDPGMQELYPFYRDFSSVGQFVLYELSYLPFFLAIEFIFRGYLLFGLAGVKDEEIARTGGGFQGRFYFHRYALLIQMLSYTAWHLGKPIPELWGTLVWGLAAGVIVYASRSIWLIVLAHWLLNVVLDYRILSLTGAWPG